jgi:hypothetical protein
MQVVEAGEGGGAALGAGNVGVDFGDEDGGVGVAFGDVGLGG